MDREETPEFPLMQSDVGGEQLAHIFDEYSRRIERIGNFVGTPGVQSVERLAIWVLRNSHAGHTLLGGICSAFTYGEKELAQRTHHTVHVRVGRNSPIRANRSSVGRLSSRPRSNRTPSRGSEQAKLMQANTQTRDVARGRPAAESAK